jgi:hypothetical protein
MTNLIKSSRPEDNEVRSKDEEGDFLDSLGATKVELTQGRQSSVECTPILEN